MKITTLLLLVSISAMSQGIANKTIKGKVVDEGGVPVAYTSITSINDPSVGTYSNSDGEFEFLVLAQSKDTLMFSCLGYESYKMPLTNIRDTTLHSVVLKIKTYILQEVTVSPDTAQAIVKKAIEMIDFNLASEKNILQGFFREIIRSDHTYDRLVEAAVDVFDKGYQKDKDLQFKIREIRKSDDFRDLDWKATIFEFISPTNGLHGNYESLFHSDYIRNNSAPYSELIGTPLNDEFLEKTTFSCDSVLQEGNDQIQRIRIHGKDTTYAFPYGVMHIRLRDFAILQMEIEMRVNQNKSTKGKSGLNFEIPGTNYIHRTIIKYREYDRKMYLSFIHRKSLRLSFNDTKMDKSKGKEGYFYHEMLFATNEIITEKDKLQRFRKKERQKKDADLYDEDWQYNRDFWAAYNAVNERPLEPRVKKDLERQTTLDEQFRKKN